MSVPDTPVDPDASSEAVQCITPVSAATARGLAYRLGILREVYPYSQGQRDTLARAIAALSGVKPIAVTLTEAWSQHFDDTAEYAGGFTEPERNGIRAAARMMRDADVRARVHSTIGGES